MKTFKVEFTGNLPFYVKKIVETIEGKDVTKESICVLDQDIKFCVCDLKEAHGNLNKISKYAWLYPRNGGNDFNVCISF